MAHRFGAFGLTLCLLMQTGCVTRNLWEQSYFVPARPAHVRLYESMSPPGVIVEYDERIAGGGKTGRRAYLLQAAMGRQPNTPPSFVRPTSEVDGLRPVPLLYPHADEELPPAAGYYAKGWEEENEFNLYRDGQSQGTFRLPYYWKRTHSVGRTLLTPVAVAVDTTFSVGTWTALAAGSVASAAHGGPCLIHR